MVKPVDTTYNTSRAYMKAFPLPVYVNGDDCVSVMDGWRQTEPKRAPYFGKSLAEADLFRDNTERALTKIVNLRNQADGDKASNAHRISELESVFVPGMKDALRTVKDLDDAAYKRACLIIDDVAKKVIASLN